MFTCVYMLYRHRQRFPAPSEESVSAEMDEPLDDDCPELVPIESDKQIPVTIITGYLGTRLKQDYCCQRCIGHFCLTGFFYK